jgi:Protein of unknown function (DUF4019)
MRTEKRANMHRFGWLAALLAAMVLLGGCDEVRTPQVQNAEPLADKLFTAIEHQDWDKALSCYGHAFYRNISEDSWRTYLLHVNKVLGPLKSYQLESETADTRFSGDFYILQYHTIYARGDAHEIITIREPSDKDVFHIIGHHITANGL